MVRWNVGTEHVKTSGALLGYEDAPSWPQYPTIILVWIDTFVQ